MSLWSKRGSTDVMDYECGETGLKWAAVLNTDVEGL